VGKAIKGLETTPSAAKDWGSGGKALSRRRQGGGVEAPKAGRFWQFFNKNNAILCIFRSK